MTENTCWCGRTREMHRKSRWEAVWGDRHDFANQRVGTTLRPMLAKNSKPFEDVDWTYERKYDGLRALIVTYSDQTAIFSRSGLELTASFPELQLLHRILHKGTYDAEIVVWQDDLNGRSESLAGLQMRMGQTDPKIVEERMKQYPVSVIFFDILQYGNWDLRSMPYTHRRAKLQQVIPPSLEVSEIVIGGDPLQQVMAEGWEGIVAKKNDSIYEEGKRRSTWKKFKLQMTWELEVKGYTRPKSDFSPYERKFGAVKCFDKNGEFRGNVGSGFTEEMHYRVWDKLQLNQGNLWVTDEKHPPIIIEVKFRLISKTGLMVEPHFINLREDKDEADDIQVA